MPSNLPPSLFTQILHLLLPYLDNDARSFVLPVIRNSRVRYMVNWAGSAKTLGDHLVELLSHDDLIALLGEVPDEVHKPAIVSLCEQIAKCRPAGALPNEDPERAYARTLTTLLAQPRYQIDKRFVRLSILVDQGVEAQTRFVPQPRPEPLNDLRDVLAETTDTPAIVLLGAPGAGKSTLLRRLQLDHAQSLLEGMDAPLTFYVPLNKYPLDERQPLKWLATEWQRECPNLSFEALMQQGRLILLLDALNEMKRRDRDDLTQRIDQWRDFLPEFTQWPNRVIVTCRSLDYSLLLDSPGLTVRQCNVEQMSADQIREFLHAYVPDKAAAAWAKLKNDSAQLKLYSTPFFLKLLTEQLTPGGDIPTGRAALFTGLIRNALSREIANRNALLIEGTPEALFTEQDRRQLPQLRDRFALPERGPLLPSLSALAYGMQLKGAQSDRTADDEDALQVRVSESTARELIAHPRAREILDAGVGLNVLEEDLRSSDDILFYHQLLQEYFAARCLISAPTQGEAKWGLVASEWRADAITPSLSETLAALDENAPLPPPRATGWEETMLLAVTMHANPDAFVRGLMVGNLPLAGRAAAAISDQLDEGLKRELGLALVARSQDMTADLRARIAAGEALGHLGDPRFELCNGPFGKYFASPLKKVHAAKQYSASSSMDAYGINTHIHDFDVAIFPVTNAEYSMFVHANGYQQEKWWRTDDAKEWLSGKMTTPLLKAYGYIAGISTQEVEKLLSNGNSLTFDALALDLGLTSTDLKAIVLNVLESLIVNTGQPLFWNDSRFNNPLQPVVGICLYEAEAYCAWLSAQTGMNFQIPSSEQWDLIAKFAAQGKQISLWESSHLVGNLPSLHLRRTTPVGVFLTGHLKRLPLILLAMYGNGP